MLAHVQSIHIGSEWGAYKTASNTIGSVLISEDLAKPAKKARREIDKFSSLYKSEMCHPSHYLVLRWQIRLQISEMAPLQALAPP